MSRPLITLRTDDTVQNAAAIFLDKNISGLPVINQSGVPVGVFTKTDIVRYEREYVAATGAHEMREHMQTLGTLEVVSQGIGLSANESSDLISNWMTPKVFEVSSNEPLPSVIQEMIRRRIHRIFVTDERTNRLTGVITTFDLMRHLSRVYHPARK